MTIADIAQLAGVSKSCVSRFFNHGYVSAEKRERIRAVVEQTGYTPGRSALGRGGRRRMVGVVLPQIASESMSRMVAGISRVLSREGIQMLLANTENSVERELACLRSFQKRKMDGLLLIATVLTDAHWELLHQMRVPVVVIGQCVDEYSCVYHNDYDAAKAMTQLMIHRGSRNIGAILANRGDYAAGEERRNGYLDALLLKGLSTDRRRVAYADLSYEAGYNAAKRLLKQAPGLDGLFCAADTIAIGAVQYLKGIGRRIPEDIRVTGIGHSNVSELIEPQLTTVHFFYMTTGVRGAELLVEIIKTGVDMKRKLKLDYKIVEQESTYDHEE